MSVRPSQTQKRATRYTIVFLNFHVEDAKINFNLTAEAFWSR